MKFEVTIVDGEEYGWIMAKDEKTAKALKEVEGWDDGTGGDGEPNVSFTTPLDLLVKVSQLLRVGLSPG